MIFIRKFQIFSLVLFLLSSAVNSQTLTYKVINVQDRLRISLPGHWHIRDADERLNIAAGGDAMINPVPSPDSTPMHVSSLSVISRPEPNTAIVRVSFVPNPDEYSQFKLKKELLENKDQVMKEMELEWKEDTPKLTAIMSKQGITYLGKEKFGAEEIGGKVALFISYQRSSRNGGAPFLVTQYHFPMGSDKILMTLAYKISDTPMKPILDRIKRSISIN